MSLVIGVVLAASAAAVPACSWDRPNVNPYKGEVAAAVDRYVDIPAAVRARLKQRMAAQRYDEIVTIRRDAIEGRHAYTDLRQMHFGQGQVCLSVTRSKWAESTVERGLVYCEGEHCIIVPTVCRNVSRVTRVPSPQAGGVPSPAGGSGVGGAPSAATPQDELLFDPPSAGGPEGAPQSPPSFAEGGGTAVAGQPLPREAVGGSFGELAAALIPAGGASETTGPGAPGGRWGAGSGGGGWIGVPAGAVDGAGNPPLPPAPGWLGRPGDLYGPPLPAGSSYPDPSKPPVYPPVPPAVPEASTWTLLALGLAVLAGAGRGGRGGRGGGRAEP